MYLLHGIGEHAGRYQRLANRLTELGYEVAAHDHPGHGKSAGKRGVIYAHDELENCSAEQLQSFAQQTGATPYLFGHSLGGLVATSMVVNYGAAVAGLLLSCPAYAPIIGPVNKLKLALTRSTAPRFAMQIPYDATLLTQDEIEQHKALSDPLIHRYKSASIVVWLIETGRRAIEKANDLQVPTLMMIAGEELVVDNRATQQFIQAAPAEYVTVHLYPDYRHEILNETPERRQQVQHDIECWLAEQDQTYSQA